MNWNQNLPNTGFLHAAIITSLAFRGCSRGDQALEDLVCYKVDAAAISAQCPHLELRNSAFLWPPPLTDTTVTNYKKRKETSQKSY